MLYVEFPLVQYIDLGEIVYDLKAVAIVTSSLLLTNFVASHVLGAKVSPEWGSTWISGPTKSLPFLWREVSLQQSSR